MNKLIIIAILLTQSLAANAQYDTWDAQRHARNLENNLTQQANQAMQQGRYDYNYNGNPGAYQLQEQANDARKLRRELEDLEMQLND